MREALYRKYRSRSLDEVVGQDHITDTLNNALKAGKISHAYLFTGPRGVGKTSIARILAHQINDIPYKGGDTNLDIIEIDAASNRRIDEIRELRDKVHIAPSNAAYKVYIIDEVHMLTKEAFNALLKTLEEPPAHVVFILATTEAHKLPDTIVSRTQRFTFKPIDDAFALEHLKKIAKQEGINIDDEALRLIINHADGSFRDSISLLDQLSGSERKVTETDVRLVIGVPPSSNVENLFVALQSKDPQKTISLTQSLYSSGFQPAMIAKGLSEIIHKQLLESNYHDADLLKLSRHLLDVPGSSDQRVSLEIALLDAALAKNSSSVVNEVKEPRKEPKAKPVIAPQPKTTPTKLSTNKGKSSATLQEKLDNGLWEKTLETLKGRYNTLYGIARMCTVSADGQALTLSFEFPFHYRRCNETRNKNRIAEIVSQLAEQDVEIKARLDSTKKKPETKHKAKKSVESGTLDSITEVFGGGELLD